ncbi:MAG: 50S ribosomal protein L17 [Candidatus Binatia bacterium]
MRHLKAGRKLNRSSAHRRALLRNLVTSLLQHEHLQTTDAKAKEMRRWVDRMITLGKRNTVHARRQAAAFVRGRDIVKKLFDEIAPRFANRPGGYTRITKLGIRHGDAAPVSLIELVERSDRARSEAEKKRERRARAAAKKEEAAAKAALPPA